MKVSELITELSKMDPKAEILINAIDYGEELYIEAITTRGELEYQDFTDEEYEAACKAEKLATHPHPSDVFIGALIWV